MPRTVALLLLLTSVAVAGTPQSVEQIPVIERPADHFYGAIASPQGVKVRWEVSAATVPLGGSFTLTLVVSNAVNPHELTRPPLMELPDFRARFTAAEDLPDESTPAGEARFRYKLTPRNEGPARIPELVYRSYQPLARTGKREQTTRALGVPFTVTPPAETGAPPVPLEGPAEFFAVRTDGVFARSGGPGPGAWVGLLAAAAGVLAGWVVGWRWLFPDAARLARIRRNRAVRVALDRLRRGNVGPEQVAITVRNYLIARWGLAFTAQTPAEVATGLVEVGVPTDWAADAEDLLRGCDAARFAGDTDTGVSPNRAAAMIERWEGVTS
jgi:hypothetical protein